MNYDNFDARLVLTKRKRNPKDRARRTSAEPESTPGNVAPTDRAARHTSAGIRAPISKGFVAALALLASVAVVFGQSYVIDINSPEMDKWVYPFAGNGGGPRPNAPTFGAIGTAGFDDRDGQIFARFNTGGTVPSGLGADSYQILSATFTLSLTAGDAVLFDSTYDAINTYGPEGEPINGDDPGRPMELYGAAFRNGVTNATLTENTSFGPPGEGTRNIYPTDFLLGASLSGSNRDVSNNVTAGFDPNPFAIGQIAPGDLEGGFAVEDADVVFTLNLANPDVLRYLQLSLDQGSVNFLATSLHEAAQGGPVVYPDYNTKENLLDGLPGRLDMQVQVVPEPASAAFLVGGIGLLAVRKRRRNAAP